MFFYVIALSFSLLLVSVMYAWLFVRVYPTVRDASRAASIFDHPCEALWFNYFICLIYLPHRMYISREINITTTQVYAILLYTYSFDSPNRWRQFYAQLVRVIQSRDRQKIGAATPFLTTLVTGLHCLPTYTGVAYRGLDHNAVETITNNYRQWKTVHWTAMSSTSTSHAASASYACKGGVGVLIEMRVRNAPVVGSLSMVTAEQEALLPPDSVFRVVKSVRMKQGYHLVKMHLLRKSRSQTQVARASYSY